MSGKAEGSGQGTAAFEGEAVASVRARWVAALRSGRYEQGREALRANGGHCCLGVLCDVVDPEGWELLGDGWVHRFHTAYPEERIRKAAGVDGISHTLADMNDKGGKSFAEIADYIESLPLPESAS